MPTPAPSPARTRPVVSVSDEFWSAYRDLVATEVLPYQWSALNDELPDAPPSHAVENLRIAAGEADGEFSGMVFQDSDVAKWIEAACYVLADRPDAELETRVDELVDLLARAQQDDGYLNSFYTVCEPPENRWSNLRDCHELYCAGHLIEAGVAHHEATGKRTLLDVVVRYADLIDRTFGPGPGQRPGYCGHPEVELALVRLADVTGEQRYLDLAAFFVAERGTAPHYFDLEAERRATLPTPPRPFDVINPADVDAQRLNYGLGYAFQQAHAPLVEQDGAVGHAVRATYLYAAATDLAVRRGDTALRQAVERLWDDVVHSKLYVTAGIGSQVPGESFTDPYDLPNETMYCETCATVGLAFWAWRMLGLAPVGEYADVLERALYNGSISGLSLDGRAYFYINTQQYHGAMDGRVLGWDVSRPSNRRSAWFACSCCPTNVARLIGSLDRMVCSAEPGTARVHLYVGGTADLDLGGGTVRLVQDARLPWSGAARVTVAETGDSPWTLALRLPGWSRSTQIRVNGAPVATDVRDGYAHLERTWTPGDVVDLALDLTPRTLRADPRVVEDVGRVAVQRGPLVYCFEEADNGPGLGAVRVTGRPRPVWEPDLLGGVVALDVPAERLSTEGWDGGDLYRDDLEPRWEPAQLRAVPYYAWANREPGEMRIWMHG